MTNKAAYGLIFVGCIVAAIVAAAHGRPYTAFMFYILAAISIYDRKEMEDD